MNRTEAIDYLKKLSSLFDVVRYVDIVTHVYLVLNEDGTELVVKAEKCFDVWGRGSACANCISARTVNKKVRSTKFEYINEQVFCIIANYVEIEGRPYSLETVTKVAKEAVAVSDDPGVVIHTIDDYNNKVYHDPLTHSYNRLYLNEHFGDELKNTAVAMIDIDYFKECNDKYGHQAGDCALATVAHVILTHIRHEDSLVRFGGDEFILFFNNIPCQVFKEKLELISRLIKAAQIPEFPEVKLSVSIGGAHCHDKKTELIKRADEMLYQAKKNRGSVVVEKHQE